MSFFEAVAACFSRYAIFRGRASRAEFWWFLLFVVLSTLVLNALIAAFVSPIVRSWVIVVYGAFLFLPMLTVSVRRMHDMGFSGWWQLLHLSGLGSVILLLWCLLPGQSQANRHGEPVVRLD